MPEEKEVKKPRIVELEEKLKSGAIMSPDEIREYENLKKQIPGYAEDETAGPTP